MQNKWINAIGLMSGTSLDGLDIAYCQFKLADGSWQWSLLEAITIPYDANLERRLRKADTINAIDLFCLDNDLGEWIGQKTLEFINKHQIKPQLIASHGHTVFHQPTEKLSFQIGSLNAIYHTLKIPVINNFRQLDVLKGGQGAPLVPVGDKLLFAQYDFCINLGGIANLSFTDTENIRKAFDISICNIGLNYLANELGQAYDKDGKIAKSGQIDISLLAQLNNLPYYEKPGPKSLGIENLRKELFPVLIGSSISVADKMATLVEHIAFQIVQVLLNNYKENARLLLTGGGAFNRALIEAINRMLPMGMEISQVDTKVIEYKEAVVFAFLGVLRALDKVNIYASVTGAQSDSIAGDLIGKVCI